MRTLAHALIAVLASTAAMGSLVVAQEAAAATVTASPASPVIGIGESTTIHFTLTLGPGEDAVVFDGRFGIVGDGTVVEALQSEDVDPGGPTWTSVDGGVSGGQVILSLIGSGNLGGTRALGSLTIVGREAGDFELVVDPGTKVERDLDTPPWFEEVPLETPIGSTLVSVVVMDAPPPVPGLNVWGALVLAGMLCSAVFAIRPSAIEAR